MIDYFFNKNYIKFTNADEGNTINSRSKNRLKNNLNKLEEKTKERDFNDKIDEKTREEVLKKRVEELKKRIQEKMSESNDSDGGIVDDEFYGANDEEVNEQKLKEIQDNLSKVQKTIEFLTKDLKDQGIENTPIKINTIIKTAETLEDRFNKITDGSVYNAYLQELVKEQKKYEEEIQEINDPSRDQNLNTSIAQEQRELEELRRMAEDIVMPENLEKMEIEDQIQNLENQNINMQSSNKTDDDSQKKSISSSDYYPDGNFYDEDDFNEELQLKEKLNDIQEELKVKQTELKNILSKIGEDAYSNDIKEDIIENYKEEYNAAIKDLDDLYEIEDEIVGDIMQEMSKSGRFEEIEEIKKKVNIKDKIEEFESIYNKTLALKDKNKNNNVDPNLKDNIFLNQVPNSNSNQAQDDSLKIPSDILKSDLSDKMNQIMKENSIKKGNTAEIVEQLNKSNSLAREQQDFEKLKKMAEDVMAENLEEIEIKNQSETSNQIQSLDNQSQNQDLDFKTQDQLDSQSKIQKQNNAPNISPDLLEFDPLVNKEPSLEEQKQAQEQENELFGMGNLNSQIQESNQDNLLNTFADFSEFDSLLNKEQSLEEQKQAQEQEDELFKKSNINSQSLVQNLVSDEDSFKKFDSLPKNNENENQELLSQNKFKDQEQPQLQSIDSQSQTRDNLSRQQGVSSENQKVKNDDIPTSNKEEKIKDDKNQKAKDTLKISNISDALKALNISKESFEKSDIDISKAYRNAIRNSETRKNLSVVDFEKTEEFKNLNIAKAFLEKTLEKRENSKNKIQDPKSQDQSQSQIPNSNQSQNLKNQNQPRSQIPNSDQDQDQSQSQIPNSNQSQNLKNQNQPWAQSQNQNKSDSPQKPDQSENQSKFENKGIYNEALRDKLIGKGAFKEIVGDDEKRVKITNKTENKDELIKVTYNEKDDKKPIIQTSKDVVVNTGKIFQAKECKGGFILQDEKGKNTIDISKDSTGKTSYILKADDPSGKKPVLNLPYGAKLEMQAGEDGKSPSPIIIVQNEKDIENLRKKFKDSVEVNTVSFSEIQFKVAEKVEASINVEFKSEKQSEKKNESSKDAINKITQIAEEMSKAGDNKTNNAMQNFVRKDRNDSRAR